MLGEPGFRDRFRTAPATESGHHAYAGGLIEHTVAVCALCRETAQLQPRLDADLLPAAALLHDCGIVDAFVDGPVIRVARRALLGHVHASLRRIERHAERLRTPRARLCRCSAASPRTTARPRAGASRAPRPSRCTPRTRSTRASTTRSVPSAP